MSLIQESPFPQFRHTSHPTDRTRDSARAFATGLFGTPDVWMPDPVDPDPLLKVRHKGRHVDAAGPKQGPQQVPKQSPKQGPKRGPKACVMSTP